MMARLILGFAVILAARAEDCQADDSSLLSLRANSSEKYYSTGMIQWDKSGTWCLSVDNNDFSSGTKLQLWECGASDGQIFNFEFNMNEATVQTAKAQFMIDPESRSNGAGISLKPTSSNGQRWKWSSKYQYGSGGTGFLRLSGNDGYCLVIDGNNPYNGAKVQLWKCGDGGPSDKYWKFVPGDTGSCQAEGGDAYHPDLSDAGKGTCCGGSEPTLCFGNKWLCLASKQCPPCAAEGQDAYDGNIKPNGQCCNGNVGPTLCNHQWFCYDSGACPTTKTTTAAPVCLGIQDLCGGREPCCSGLTCTWTGNGRTCMANSGYKYGRAR
mmetsp:Transcript_93365/g.166039  ORF Transcript_93365/g.166039 Transcript_93365/m.166039 type:complete len:325 (+) Transcript_93365:66-1040(+)